MSAPARSIAAHSATTSLIFRLREGSIEGPGLSHYGGQARLGQAFSVRVLLRLPPRLYLVTIVSFSFDPGRFRRLTLLISRPDRASLRLPFTSTFTPTTRAPRRRGGRSVSLFRAARQLEAVTGAPRGCDVGTEPSGR